jgi:hypothetical protein
MKDKFCVSKTLTYLVLLVGAIVATFYATNYANTQKLTSESQAAGKVCIEKGVKGVIVSVAKNTSCDAYAIKLGTLFHPYTNGDVVNNKNEVTSVCCIPDRKPTPVKGSTCVSQTGGNWYRVKTADKSGITACSDLGKGYGDAPAAVTETVNGYRCCVTSILPTATAGVTCKQQGGIYYRSSRFYTDGFAGCSAVATKVGTPFVLAPKVSTDQETGLVNGVISSKYFCCVPGKVPTSTPVPTTSP